MVFHNDIVVVDESKFTQKEKIEILDNAQKSSKTTTPFLKKQ